MRFCTFVAFDPWTVTPEVPGNTPGTSNGVPACRHPGRHPASRAPSSRPVAASRVDGTSDATARLVRERLIGRVGPGGRPVAEAAGRPDQAELDAEATAGCAGQQVSPEGQSLEARDRLVQLARGQLRGRLAPQGEDPAKAAGWAHGRSEERRVGKEWGT